MLSKTQEIAYNYFSDNFAFCLRHKQNKICFLQGQPGTGKSFLIASFLKYILDLLNQKTQRRFLVTAPSHEALNSLRGEVESKCSQTQLGIVDFKTIASSLSQFCTTKGGFSKGNNKKIAQYDLIIVDEVSMVGDLPLKMIVEGIKPGCFLILLGDPFQFSPVKAKENQAIKAVRKNNVKTIYGKSFDVLKLKEQQRMPVEILELAKEYQFALGSKDAKNIKIPTKTNYCQSLDYAEFSRTLIDVVGDSTSSSKIICFRNKNVNHWNKFILDNLFGGEILAPGVKIRCCVTNKRGKNNASYEVVDCEKTKKVIPKEFLGESCDGIRLAIFNTITDKSHVYAMHKDTYLEIKQYLIYLEWGVKNGEIPRDEIAFKLWNQFNYALQKCLIFDYDYAITAHKAQGKTFDNVFLDRDFWETKSGNAKQSLYVGITRTKKKLYVLN